MCLEENDQPESRGNRLSEHVALDLYLTKLQLLEELLTSMERIAIISRLCQKIVYL